MAALGERLASGLNACADAWQVGFHCASLGGMFTPFFRGEPVRNQEDAQACDTTAHAAFFHHMLAHAIYLPPSQFEVAFLSAAHTRQDVDAFLEAAGTWTM